METAFLAGGGSLDLDVDFTNTTQYNQAFNVRTQGQDGLPEGNLVGLDIGDDGLIVASYSNGSQTAVGKVLLANFPSTDGLNPRGDSSFLGLQILVRRFLVNRDPRPLVQSERERWRDRMSISPRS